MLQTRHAVLADIQKNRTRVVFRPGKAAIRRDVRAGCDCGSVFRAQFAREVISERIRDKFAASRKRGVWTGGTVPLGCAVKDRKLVVVPQGAATVRLIFECFCIPPAEAEARFYAMFAEQKLAA